VLDEPNELIDCRKRRFLLPGATGPVSTESAVFLEARGHLLHRQTSERFQDGSSAAIPALRWTCIAATEPIGEPQRRAQCDLLDDPPGAGTE
jgi:hypothetical protein